jgi:hypothetical protein
MARTRSVARRKIQHQDDVAIDVAQDLVLGDGLGAGKEIVHSLGAEFVALHERLVTQAELKACFGSARIIAKENHFDAGMEGLQRSSKLESRVFCSG